MISMVYSEAKKRMRNLWAAVLLFCLTLLMSFFAMNSAYAQDCANPNGVLGDVIYNDSHNVFQGCTQRGWMGFHKVGAPDCPNVGDSCLDGTINAGLFNSDYNIYVMPTNQTTNPWRAGAGAFDDVASDSSNNGLANSNQILNSATFPAAKQCKDLNFGGKNDFYLPARNELVFVWSQLKSGNPSGHLGFTHTEYWSSTESPFNAPTQYALSVSFSNGTAYSSFTKSTNKRVRCVRRN